MSGQSEIYDDDDTVFGDWSGAVPWKMQRWTEHKLQMAHVYGSQQTARFVESELYRRRNNELKAQIKGLTEATDSVRQATRGVDSGVLRLTASSEAMEKLTRSLIKTSRESNEQITALNASSAKMESLTVALKNFTVVLIALGVLGVLVPIGIEVWHAKREIQSPVPPIVLERPRGQ